jgi:hypothetical protein
MYEVIMKKVGYIGSTAQRVDKLCKILCMLCITGYTGSTVAQAQNLFPLNGKTGIGTTGPFKALHIINHRDNGWDATIRLSEGSTGRNPQDPNSGTPVDEKQAHLSILSPDNLWAYTGSAQVGDVVLQASPTAGNIILTTHGLDKSLLFKVRDFERVRITDGGGQGRMGINQQNPLGPLHIDNLMILRDNAMSMNIKTEPLAPYTTTAINPSVPCVSFFCENWSSENKRIGILVDKTAPLLNDPNAPRPVSWSRIGYQFKGMIINADNGFMGVGSWDPQAMLEVRSTPRTNANTREIAFRVLNSAGVEQFRIGDDGYGMCRELKVAVPTSGDWTWSDYVFKKDYKLMPLGEVEEFIEQNGHLPGVPSAEDVKQNGGVEVSRIQAKLLEKIEELTLHLIRMEKELEATKSQLKKQTQGETK